MEGMDIVGLIGSVGFPVVMCCMMWKYISTTLKEFREAVTANTMMLEKMIEKLDYIYDERIDKHEQEHTNI